MLVFNCIVYTHVGMFTYLKLSRTCVWFLPAFSNLSKSLNVMLSNPEKDVKNTDSEILYISEYI